MNNHECVSAGRMRCALVGGLSLVVLLGACERSQTPATSDPNAKTQTDAVVKTAPTSAEVQPVGATTGTFLDRDDAAVLRVVTYNVNWNSIFPDVSAQQAGKFARIVHALNPDILGLQEIGTSPQERRQTGAKKRTAEDVLRVMNAVAPLPNGATWYAFQGGDEVIVSKYPLLMARAQTDPPGEREQALALVDLPDDRFAVDVYFMCEHFKCCGGETNEAQRQRQADAVMAWLRDARTPGPQIDLLPGTPIIIAGDLNLVDGPRPLQTLVAGDIKDEAQFGRKFAPDWDDTPLTDARPLHNVAGPDDWTWRDDSGQFPPNRLDYVVYTDSVLEVAKKFVLNTTTLAEADLRAMGLQKFDVAKDDVGKSFDHLPVVVDFRVNTAALEKGETATE